MLSLNSSFFRASSAMGSVLLGGALLISGCGGGGGGATVPTATPIGTPAATATPTSTPIPGLVFSDEFNSGSLDRSKWTTLTSANSLQRTQFGNQPRFAQDTDGTRFMRVPLDTYLPNASGELQLYGTEVAANQKITRGTGVEFTARLRMSNPEQGGLIASFFLFGQQGNFNGTPPLTFDEIDHEVLTNGLQNSSPFTWTNSYNDFIIPQTGFPNGDSYDDSSKTIAKPVPLTSGYSKEGWNLYRIVWRPGQVQWFINDQEVRSETSGVIPNDPLGVRFNLWAAKSPFGWDAAYSATLQPAATSAANKTYSLDVDWVRVRTLDATTTGTTRSTASSNVTPLSSAEITRGLSGAGYQSSKKR